MPKATTEEEANWPLDADTPYRARLLNVEERKKEGGVSRRTGKPFDAFTTWLWKFEVTEGPKAGQWAWIETEDRLTTRDDNKVKRLTEALLRMQVHLGFDLDTDDLLDLECYIQVANQTYTKSDGTTGYRTPIVDAFALDDDSRAGDEPPF